MLCKRPVRLYTSSWDSHGVILGVPRNLSRHSAFTLKSGSCFEFSNLGFRGTSTLPQVSLPPPHLSQPRSTM